MGLMGQNETYKSRGSTVLVPVRVELTRFLIRPGAPPITNHLSLPHCSETVSQLSVLSG